MTLILNSGGLRSLIATAMHLCGAEPGKVMLVHVRDARAAGLVRAERAKKQAAHFHIPTVIDSPASPADMFVKPRILLSAIAEAIRVKAQRIIWPAQCDAGEDGMMRTTEQLVLVQHLAQLEHADLPEIDTPLLELSDKQLIELGGQLDVPWKLAWSCQHAGDQPCGACDPCRRRRRAFESAGIVDPAAGATH